MKPHHVVKNIAVTNRKLSLEIDGKLHTFELDDISKLLATASVEEAANFEVSPRVNTGVS